VLKYIRSWLHSREIFLTRMEVILHSAYATGSLCGLRYDFNSPPGFVHNFIRNAMQFQSEETA
jgi:hypothetical protein